MNTIDQSARERGLSYPKPKLAFLETSEPNAFVVSAFYCYARKDPVEEIAELLNMVMEIGIQFH